MEDADVLWPSHSVVVSLGQDLLATLLMLMAVTSIGFHSGTLRGSIWIADEDANSLAVLDTKTNRVMTTMVGIRSPHNVQVSPDNTTVWAASGSGNVALAIDATTYTVRGAVPTGALPAHITLTPDGKNEYVTKYGENQRFLAGCRVQPEGARRTGPGFRHTGQ